MLGLARRHRAEDCDGRRHSSASDMKRGLMIDCNDYAAKVYKLANGTPFGK